MKDKMWIQSATKKEGRVRNYIMRVYGEKAFTQRGTIKFEYLDKAIARVESGKGKDRDNLLKALRLAKTLKKM